MKIAFWVLLPILIILGIFGWIYHSAQSSLRQSDHAFDLVNIGDPIEVLDGLIQGDRVDRKTGIETGSWADVIERPVARDVAGEVLFRQKGFSGIVIWHFAFDKEKRVTEKYRLTD